MLKYVETAVTFSEIPDEITLCINLSNCPCKCIGCHSSYLAEDIGEILTFCRIKKLLDDNKGVTAICFMGGDSDPGLINHYAKLIKELRIERRIHNIVVQTDTPIKVGWYSGRQELAKEIDLDNFDFIKLGPYIEELGPLTSETTNQRFYKVVHMTSGKNIMYDITYKFRKHEIED